MGRFLTGIVCLKHPRHKAFTTCNASHRKRRDADHGRFVKDVSTQKRPDPRCDRDLKRPGELGRRPPILPDMGGVISGDSEDFWIGGHISGV
jgi:hypothetical protein